MSNIGTKLSVPLKYGCYLALLTALGLLTACSGVKTYSNTLDKNLHVTSKIDSATNAAVEIYQVEPNCSIKYTGTIQLDHPDVDVGIPTGRSSYLVFVFASSGFFSATTSTTYSTLIRPRAGHRYDINVSYLDDIYNVVMHEGRKGSNKNREINSRNLAACRPL